MAEVDGFDEMAPYIRVETMRKPRRYKITLEVTPGAQVTGEFEVQGDLVTVYYLDKSDAARLEGMRPGEVARLLLGELAKN